jgi:hypothetical protein
MVQATKTLLLPRLLLLVVHIRLRSDALDR